MSGAQESVGVVRTWKEYSKSSPAGWRFVTFSRSALIDKSSLWGVGPRIFSHACGQGHDTHDHDYFEGYR